MATIHRTVKLAAEPQRLMEYISDVQNHPAFISALKSVENLSGDSHQLGTRWKWTFVMAGVEIQGEAETVAFQEGKRFAFKTTTGVESTFTYTAESAPGGSNFHMEVSYEPPRSVLAKVVDAAVVERQNEAEADRTARNIQTVFEG